MTEPADHLPELQRLKDISDKLVSPELATRGLEELPDALVFVTDDGKIVLFNRQAELMFGYSRVEVFGKQIEILVPEASRAAHANHRSGYVNDPRARPMGSALSLVAKHKTRGEFPVKINLAPIQTTDGLFVMAVVRRTDT